MLDVRVEDEVALVVEDDDVVRTLVVELLLVRLVVVVEAVPGMHWKYQSFCLVQVYPWFKLAQVRGDRSKGLTRHTRRRATPANSTAFERQPVLIDHMSSKYSHWPQAVCCARAWPAAIRSRANFILGHSLRFL